VVAVLPPAAPPCVESDPAGHQGLTGGAAAAAAAGCWLLLRGAVQVDQDHQLPVLQHTTQHSTAQHSTTQHSTAQGLIHVQRVTRLQLLMAD